MRGNNRSNRINQDQRNRNFQIIQQRNRQVTQINYRNYQQRRIQEYLDNTLQSLSALSTLLETQHRQGVTVYLGTYNSINPQAITIIQQEAARFAGTHLIEN